MVLALLVAALVGQTVYEWTDAQGQAHYTDDPSTIPRGAKVRTTEGEELTVVGASAKALTPDAGVRQKVRPPAAPKRDRCAEAAKKVRGLEEKLAKEKQAHELALLRRSGDCQQILRTHGQAEYAKCTRRGRPSVEPPPGPEALERELETARELLRRAQVSGCEE